jgi:hypothetical protein
VNTVPLRKARRLIALWFFIGTGIDAWFLISHIEPGPYMLNLTGTQAQGESFIAVSHGASFVARNPSNSGCASNISG